MIVDGAEDIHEETLSLTPSVLDSLDTSNNISEMYVS